MFRDRKIWLTAWVWLVGAMLSGLCATKPASTTLTAEEQQQFLYYFYEAHRLIQADSLDTAWELLQFCHELNPNDANVNNYIGMFYSAMDKPSEALPYLKRAFELCPNEYWNQYAIYLLSSKEKKDNLLAIRNLEQVAKTNRKNENLHRLLQKAYIHVQDYKDALKIQDQLDSIIGYNAMSAMQRYRMNALMGNTLQAIYEIERYLEEEPADMQFQAFRLELYEKTNQPSEKMVKAYMAMLPYEPRNLVLKNNLAWHLCLLGKELDMAEQLSRTTIMAEPQHPVYLDTYAWIMYQTRDYESALFYIQRAMEHATPETIKEINTHYKAIIKKLNK